MIKPYIVDSLKEGNENKKRKSWIYILYDKDKLIKKKEELE